VKTINLDALDRMQHAVELQGQTYPVRSLTPRIASIIDAATDADGVEKVRGFVNAVAALVPTMPRAAVDDLSIPQLYAIVELATTQVAVVEEAAADPNVASSAPTTVTEPATPPAT
jgi:hypothetical protein